MTAPIYDPTFVENYDGHEVLLGHADHLRDLAGRRDIVGDMAGQAAGLDWKGAGKEGSDGAWAEHVGNAGADARMFTDAATTAESAASNLYRQRNDLTAMLEQTRNSGYAVDSEWTAVDASGADPDSAAGAMRQTQAQQITGELRSKAMQFAATDQQAGIDLTHAAVRMTPADFKASKKDIDGLLDRVKVVPQMPVPGRPYDRSCKPGHDCDFGPAWFDGSPCDTRDRLLQTSLHDVIIGPDGCHVIGGWEIDPYSGKRITLDQIQVDHIFPLKDAWDAGAWQWSATERRAFANDMDEIVPVSSWTNQAKGASTPSDWLPPLAAEQPDYVERYLQVATKYDLPITQADYDAIKGVANTMHPADLSGQAAAPHVQMVSADHTVPDGLVKCRDYGGANNWQCYEILPDNSIYTLPFNPGADLSGVWPDE